jgi:hypothetical protein
MDPSVLPFVLPTVTEEPESGSVDPVVAPPWGFAEVREKEGTAVDGDVCAAVVEGAAAGAGAAAVCGFAPDVCGIGTENDGMP